MVGSVVCATRNTDFSLAPHMAADSGLNDNSRLHPEEFASAAATAEAYGGRFWVEVDPGVNRAAAEWRRYEGRGGPWKDGDVTASAFDPVFRILLDAMNGCRVSGLTKTMLARTSDAPVAWLGAHARRSDRTYDIDVHSPGVGDDLDAWWWLVRHAGVCISCDAARLDASTLFTTAPGVRYRTTRFLPSAVREHAKDAAAIPGSVAIVPLPDGGGWQMMLAASSGLAGSLAQEAVRRCQVPPEVLAASEAPPDVAILATTEASTFWSSGITPDTFEKTVAATLRRGEKYPTIPRDAMRALAAAEGVAIAEGRGLPRTDRDGLAELVTTWIVERAEKADALTDATIQLASRTVTAIISAGVSERTRWQSEAGRMLYRAELEGLLKRLHAAQAARQARAHAPNAIPLPALRKVHGRPINWRTQWLHLMLGDAVAFISAVRDATGATPLILMKDLTFRELPSDWDVREMVSRIRGHPFDERDGDWPGIGWPELQLGTHVRFWWPDVSPRPVAHGTEQNWEIVSWGHAELLLRGATPGRVLRSEWTYPTGTELKQEKFAGPGPWRDVDWKLLRRKVKDVRALVTGVLGGVAPMDVRDTWTLPVAAASARAGARVLMGEYMTSVGTLPP
jgi:hypothetical protein